jgi:hypothetical protein
LIWLRIGKSGELGNYQVAAKMVVGLSSSAQLHKVSKLMKSSLAHGCVSVEVISTVLEAVVDINCR